jgi:hypothetical protein
MDDSNIEGNVTGVYLALATGLRALIATHPDKTALLAALDSEHQETLAFLTANPYPDQTLEAFHMAWSFLGLAEKDPGQPRVDWKPAPDH